jgi:endonuclease/exonuclease/phosphatase family metal-dependent hydrolase
MRRIASAIGPVLALVAVTAPTTPAHSLEPRSLETRTAAASTTPAVSSDRVITSARRSSGIGLDSTTLGTSYVNVSWNWIKAASGYKIQVAKKSDFSAVVSSHAKANSRYRPAGGREATVVGHLKDARYYWVRVRKVSGGHQGPWSAPLRVATKAAYPDKITSARGEVGANAGESRLRWKSGGAHTDFYRITTALSPFGTKGHPGPGLNQMTFKAPGTSRSFTMTPQMTAAAGAAMGSGNHLFFRITAVRKGVIDSRSRAYGHLMHTAIAGEPSSGAGRHLRFGQYNMRIVQHDAPGHPWKDRASLIAKNIVAVGSDVMSIQELLPPMWTDQAGGPGLQKALSNAGGGSYRLTRTTYFAPGNSGDSRILYNSKVVQDVSGCDPTTLDCLIPIPGDDYAAYAKFQVNGTSDQFYFVSAHLKHGNDATTDALRGRQVLAISNAIKQIDTAGLPVVFGGDYNSAQNSAGSDSPHRVLFQEGWYNTSAAVDQINLQYNSVNGYKSKELPSPYGFGALFDTIETLNLPGADRFKIVRTGQPWPSDHNMVFTDVHLP